ncbi:MAG: indoleamine 2,3-dioxygenase, partial [Halobacteriota archaeon]
MRGDVLETHDITASRGFLPTRDPLTTFDTDRDDGDVAAYLDRLDRLGRELPDRLAEGSFRPAADALPTPPPDLLDDLTEPERERLCLLTSFFASGYVHEVGADPVDRLPAGIAVPLVTVSDHLGRKPIAAYDTICLRNFALDDDEQGFEVENIRPIQRFTGLDDERWFVAIHVAIEAAAGLALVACAHAQRATRSGDDDALLGHLRTIARSLERQTAIMRRMTEGNEPTAFVEAFRPYYQGFEGVRFVGVGGGEG